MKKIILALLINLIFTQTSVFTLCEGNFQSNNASLWYFNNENGEEIFEAPNNPIGDTGQSMTVYENKLYAIMNASGLIHIYNITQNGLEFDHSYDTQFAGPRHLLIVNDLIYITEWNTNQIRVLDLNSESIIATIPVNGLPEDIITNGEFIYVSITMNSDWSSANSVIELDLNTNQITREFTVGNNPEKLVIIDNNLFVSSTFYDQFWYSHYTISRINLASQNGNNFIYEDNSGLIFGSDLTIVNGNLFRSTSSGAIKINLENLNIIEGSEIGALSNVYSMDYYNEKFYFGTTDFVAPDEIFITDINGNTISSFSVGAIPGSFAFWESELELTSIKHLNEFRILNSYPNPFNPIITFEINIEKNDFIRADIFNINGELVEQLIHNKLTKGIHQLSWDAESKPSGIYFLKISTNFQSITEKITLQK
ncbi:MAG: T9SS type A sorting domain-containing protein [Candidatus Marinimicrobia bacterium]|nr:T9SS type A sorting domain-containing protein [Candidatus Neomarinimicrobiota bacterium]